MALATTPPTDLPPADGDQEAVDEAYLRFRTNGVKLGDPPAKDDSVTLIVKGTCTGVHLDTMKDGEEKVTHVIEVDSAYERGKVPIVDEGKPAGLFDFVSDQDLWQEARDTAFERGEVIDDVITGFLRDYITSADQSETPSTPDADPEPDAVDVDTKADGGKVLRPEFSDTKDDK